MALYGKNDQKPKFYIKSVALLKILCLVEISVSSKTNEKALKTNTYKEFLGVQHFWFEIWVFGQVNLVLKFTLYFSWDKC